jgi:serine/threonine-protein kinase
MSRLKRLIVEIHRHSLWQIVGIYLGGAWLAYEIIQGITEGRGLPEWLPAFALVLLVIGLPFVVATAFVREDAAPPPLEPSTPEAEAAAAQAQAEARREAVGRRRFLTLRNAVASFVVALAVWGVVATGWMLFGERAVATEDGRKSIAVLPFENLSGNEEAEPFTNGIHDDILTQLYKIADLTPISRTSVMEYRSTTKNLRQIANELGVATVLEGGVQRSGHRVRINVQLIDARTDEHMWAETYDLELTTENIFAIQTDVARRIAEALRATLSPEEDEQIAARPTDNLQAYDYYLRGREQRPTGPADRYIRIAMYEKAVELDPGFAQAYAALANSHISMYWWYLDRTGERLASAKAAVDRALQLEPDLPGGHNALGAYYSAIKDFERARHHTLIALAGEPNNAGFVIQLAGAQARRGEWTQAIASFKRATVLNPRSPGAFWNTAAALQFVRQYAEAEQYFDRAISLGPAGTFAYVAKARLYLAWHGEVDRARRMLDDAPRQMAVRDILGGNISGSRWLFRTLSYGLPETVDTLTLESLSSDSVTYYFAKADLYGVGGPTEVAIACYDSARAVLERRVESEPEEARIRSLLGIAYAGLGDRAGAIREGTRAVELLPVSRDAMDGPEMLAHLSEMYVMLGDYDLAIDQLEVLLSIPSWLSAAWLEVDPLWAPLRDHPRFQALVEEYAQPASN